jgi:hypothetical protein
MSLSRFLKSAGLIEDDKPSEAPVGHVPPKAAPPARNPAPVFAHDEDTEASASSVDDKEAPTLLDTAGLEASIEEHIKSAPEFALFAGFYKDAEAMKKAIPDERVRFVAAQATTDLSCADLCTSVLSYKEAVVAETVRFNEVYVGKEQAHIDQCTTLVDTLQAQITELTVKLGELSKRKNDYSNHIIAMTGGLEKAKIDFGSVVSTVTARYEELLKKLHQHLGA